MDNQVTENSLSMNGPFKVCPDYIAKFWKKTETELHNLGIHLNDFVTVTFGINKFPFIDKDISKRVQAVANNLGGAHHAVILKLENKKKCAFRLELEVDEGISYVNKKFKCPNEECNFQTHFFSELANHHYLVHVVPEGEDVYYECCGNVFRNFQSYCLHQYKNHSTKGAIKLNFKQIRENNFENFLDQVQFFRAYTKSTSMRHVLQCGVDIILNFGRYWVHCWNCQDFATWYLLLVGVPLRNIDPTLTDKLTGSGTDSSARSIKRKKETYLYKRHNELEMHDLTELKAGTCCNEIGCERLPPMSLEALTRHMEVAHTSDTISVGVPLRNIDPTLTDKLTGSGTNSSARSIKRKKETYLYKRQNEPEMHDLTDLKTGTCCNEIGCERLPPMSLEALTRHMEVAHSSDTISGSSTVDLFNDFRDIVSGKHIGLNLNVKSKRKYSLYQLRGSTFCSHTSLVFSPWPCSVESTNHRYEFYHTAEKVIDGTESKLHVRTITEKKNLEKLRYICDVDISIEELLDYIYVIYKFPFYDSSDGTCMDFFVNLVSGLRYFLGRRIIDPSVQEGLLAKHEQYRSLTDDMERRNALSQILQFFALNDEIQEDIQYAKSAYLDDVPQAKPMNQFERLNSYFQTAMHSTATKLTEMTKYDKEWVCLHPLITMFLMSFNNLGLLFLSIYLVFTLILILCFGYPLLPQPGLNGLLECLKGITQPREWLNILSAIRNVPFVVSLIVLTLEVVSDREMLMSAFIMQYVWTISITLERDVHKRLTFFHEITLQNVHEVGIAQLIQLGTRNTIFRCLVAIGLLLPSDHFSYILCTLVFVITIFFSFDTVGKYIFPGGLPISLFTFQYLKIINHSIVLLYLGAIASICIQGVIRVPVFQISKFHCIAIYIYTSLSWYIRHKNKLHICKKQAVYYKAVEIDQNAVIPNKQLLTPWLSIFRLSILVSSILLNVICSVPMICVCFLDAHVSLFITFVALYLHCILHYFTIDVQYVISVLIGDAIDRYKVSRQHIKLKITDLLYSSFRFPGTNQ